MLDKHSTIWPTFTNCLSLSCQCSVEWLTLHDNYPLIVSQLSIFTHQIRVSVRRILKYFTIHIMRSNLYIGNGMRVFGYKFWWVHFEYVFSSNIFHRTAIYQFSVFKSNFMMSRYLKGQFKAIKTWWILKHLQLNPKLTRRLSIWMTQLTSSFMNRFPSGLKIYIKHS